MLGRGLTGVPVPLTTGRSDTHEAHPHVPPDDGRRLALVDHGGAILVAATNTEVLDAQVRWYGASDDEHEDGCRNRDDALAFIHRALADGVTAEAIDFRDAGERVVVVLQTHQPPE